MARTVARNPEAIGQVYWLGGGSCAGKSTIAGMLAERHGYGLYDGDPGAPLRFLRQGLLDHKVRLKRIRESSEPTASMRWFYSLPPREIAQVFIEFSESCVPLIANELAHDENSRLGPIIVDTFFGHPTLLAKVSSLDRTVFIIADYAFQKRELESRSWPRSVMESEFTSSQEIQSAFDNWLEAHRLIAEFVVDDCRKNNVPCEITTGVKTLEESYEYVVSMLGITPVKPADLPDVSET